MQYISSTSPPLYNCETATLKEKNLSKITAAEMRFFRKPTKFTLFNPQQKLKYFEGT
jgi:hypothetical protein